MLMKIKHSLTLGVAAVALTALVPVRADDALDLFNRMRAAVHNLDYAGSLVYLQGTNPSTYQIKHTVENGAEKESVVRLTQEGGRPNSGEVSSFSLAKLPQVQTNKEQVYSFDLGDQERVANHTCQIVVARPRDRMRYLQRYCIEPESGMLLKYSLTDREHKTIEQFFFTTLDLLASSGAEVVNLPAQAFAPANKAVVTVDSSSPTEVNSTEWQFNFLPDGFQQVDSLAQSNGDKQLILSDGMTSVSVFIAADNTQQNLPKNLEYSSGAMNIFTQQIEGHKITLVGEVPVDALRRIAHGIKHVK